MSDFMVKLSNDLLGIRNDLFDEIEERRVVITKIEAALREINIADDPPPVRRRFTKATVKVGDGVVAGSATGEVI